MRTRLVGDVRTSAIGLGCMPMSVEDFHVPHDRCIATIHAALDAGVRLLDTADAYSPTAAMGHNEAIVAEALRTWPGDADDVLVATKGGLVRPADDEYAPDGRPEHIRAACDASLRRLGVEAIGLYQHHVPDPQVPYEESVGALAELREAGKVRMVGVCNVTSEHLDRARAVTEIASVQNALSPGRRDHVALAGQCEDLGIALLAHSPFGGVLDADTLARRAPAMQAIADERGVSVHQVCLAWLLALAANVIPIPGSSRPATATASARAVDLRLSPDEVARLS